MQSQIEFACETLLDRTTQAINHYEGCLNELINLQQTSIQVQAQTKCAEKQLGYLLRVTNSLFSYGLPSSQSKLKLRELPAEQIQQGVIRNRYDDLTILSRFIYLIKLANQLK